MAHQKSGKFQPMESMALGKLGELEPDTSRFEGACKLGSQPCTLEPLEPSSLGWGLSKLELLEPHTLAYRI